MTKVTAQEIDASALEVPVRQRPIFPKGVTLKTVRRIGALAATAALTATGLGVVAPAAIAQAAEECTQTGSFTDGTWTYNKKFFDAEVAPGGTVKTEIKLTAGLTAFGTKKITDIHPEELQIQSATVEAWHINGKHQTHPVQVTADSPTRATVRNTAGVGWAMTNGYVTAVFTYKVAEDAKPGTLLNVPSGMVVGYSGLEPDTERDDMGVCIKVREKNPVETVTGSLERAGLGSATGSADGGSTGSQISSDPSGFIADIINQINLGKLIGLS
ncbi:hypothetical protein [Dietzia sp. ANT_WB102]|uniref:hypothetical protein n=1 Tax=Dietzia sp. ANT_WB102 TaxID=2597345 RepID=UPI0011EDE5B3|nr:hypothetical protein [Dietzia sp. ANT_WB102]KAA0916547.1 hypothetical protein FQ137_15160 [Dietzia sp. ANT_WB102]